MSQINRQTNLFDEENYYRNAYRIALNEFDIEKAIATLKKWQRTFFPPSDLDDKIAALNKLSEIPVDNIEILADMYINLYSTDYLKLFKDERNSIKKGLTQKIYNLLSIEDYNFIITGLHPAEIYLNMEDFKAVFSSCNQYLNHIGENPLIRQFEAYAFYQQGETNSSAILSTYALFDNVLKCRVDYLCPVNFVKKYDYLLHATGSQHSALLRLPFALWKDGKTHIVPNDDKFEKYLRKCINRERKIPTRSIDEDTLYFYHLQYLAEMIRLRNTRKVVSQELIDIRSEMSEVNHEMFGAYMDTLSSAFQI